MNLVEKIAELLKLSKVEVSLEQLPLEDGTILEAEKFEVGFSIGVVTPDGIVPAPIGEHKLADGRIIVVMTEGIIEEVKEVEEMSTEVAPEQSTQTASEPSQKEPKRIVESVSKETFFEAIKEVENHFEAKLSALKLELSKVEDEPQGIKPQQPNVEPISKNYKGIEAQMQKIINS